MMGSIFLESTEVGAVWLDYLRSTLKTGVRTYDNVEDVFESRPTHFSISDFSDAHGILKEAGNPHIINIYRRKMFEKEIIDELNSTYGDRLFGFRGIDQISDAILKLKENRWAKSCFIPLVVPNDPGPRIPCLSAIQISIRNDKLRLDATFRSQNVFNAYGNFLGLYALSEHIARRIGIEFGVINFSVNFPHIYERDIDKSQFLVDRFGSLFHESSNPPPDSRASA